MKRDLLFAFTAFFFMSLSAITGVYAVEQAGKMNIFSEEKYDVSGDGKKDTIILKGLPFEEGANFQKDVFLEVKASNGKTYEVKLAGGYEPVVDFKDVNHDGVLDMFVSIPSGGSGGLSNYYLYTLKDFKMTDLTVPDPVAITSQFEENYQASITIDKTGKTYRFDLSSRKDDYERLGLYRNGKLNEPTELMVFPYSTLKVVESNGTANRLLGVQRISGAYSADAIAFVESEWSMENGKWILIKTAVYETGASAPGR
ncbi:hypothetical protein CVD25_13905 [Bacillus canaveralius]|uniref:VCBS repeat-containing protein n=1 Tax=Bacillus canaveralius TaxID=1403243 RepID=A0A2N5GLC5_9BACI|nr:MULTISPECIES: hypothetical protein [Bacillus]PLR82443.1 hypothetical protein CU635_11570 [Bacillus canaveralius]PLR85700.1 hypothetical protein CVD23_08385 [Bacillus sp. V33-4]PLR95614.1 hypothetical protein CVD25_13905 [Bacillus canaveralius]RSK52837.1 hypothetical protein EJA13_10205 [Bacillus canaveralius]